MFKCSNNMPWSVATILYDPPLRRKRALLSPHIYDEPLFSDRFCPRSLVINHHFSQKSALKGPKIRAVDWAYRGPRERKDAGPRESSHMCHMPWSVATILYDPPLRRKRALLSPPREDKIIFSTILSSFFWSSYCAKWSL
jgi:hypothetical protein